MKRWVAYQAHDGRPTRPVFLVEAETEREALCLASDRVLLQGGADAQRGPWSGAMVHVCLAEHAPEADVALAEGITSGFN
ncbi:MAG TPA: hypothetical protein VKZ63_12025 [Kofleriaceae bacterium]|nr:hypothetical protein [Kofleriaceae bacterium]